MAWSGLDRTVRTRLARTRVYYGWVVVAGCFLGAMAFLASGVLLVSHRLASTA